MRQLKLPNNVQSILSNIDTELFEELKTVEQTEYRNVINNSLQFYTKLLNKRVLKNEIEEYDHSSFLDILQYAIEQTQYSTQIELIDDIIEQVCRYLMVVYWKILVQYAKDNDITKIYIIPNKTADYKNKYLAKLITDIHTFEMFMLKLNSLEHTIILGEDYVDKVINLANDVNITIYHCPQKLLSNIRILLYQLMQYDKFISIQDITLQENMSYYDMQCDIINKLLRDKLLKVIDVDLIKNSYADMLANDSINDINAKIDYIEYFMYFVCLYFIDNEFLQSIWKKQFSYIHRLLTNEVII